MEKLTFQVVDVTTSEKVGVTEKTKEVMQQVVELYNSLPINKGFVVPSSVLSGQTLRKEFIKAVPVSTEHRYRFKSVKSETETNAKGEPKTVGTRIEKVLPKKEKPTGEVAATQE